MANHRTVRLLRPSAEQLELERKVLSTLLLGGIEAYKKLPPFFGEHCFEDTDHRTVFKEIVRHAERGEFFDLIKIGEPLSEFAYLLTEITKEGGDLGDGLYKAAEGLFLTHQWDKSDSASDGAMLQGSQQKSVGVDEVKVLTGSEILTRAKTLPEVKDLVKHIMRDKSLNFLAGEGGCGKSILAMNLALAVAVGAKKFLAWELEKRGKVLFLNFELYFEDFARRLDTMCRRLPVRGDVDNFLAPIQMKPLKECWTRLNDVLRLEQPCLVVVDCLYFAHNEDESDNSKMKDIVRKLLFLRDEHKTCVLVVHHTKKGVQSVRLHNDLMRGAGVFGAAADTVLMMRRSQADPRKRIVKATKLRHAADANLRTRLLSLNQWLWFKDEGEADEGKHMSSLGFSSGNRPEYGSGAESEILETLIRLKDEVQHSVLAVKRITEAFNEGRPPFSHFTLQKMGRSLDRMGFGKGKTGKHGNSAIIWNEKHVERMCEIYGVDITKETSDTSETVS